MKRQTRILAGTALSVLMASAPLTAAPLPGGMVDSPRAPRAIVSQAPMVLAQTEEVLPQDAQPAEEVLPKKKHRQVQEEQQPAPEAAAPAERAPQEEPAQPKKKHRQVQEEQQPAPQAAAPAERAPQEEPTQPKKKGHKQSAEQPVDEMAPAPAEEPVKPRKKHKEAPAAEQPAAAEDVPAPAEKPVEAKPEKPRKNSNKQAPAAEQPAAAEEAPAPAEKPAEAKPEKPRKNGNKPAPAAEQPAATEEAPAPAAEQPAPAEEAVPAPTEKPAEATQPADAKPEKPGRKGNKGTQAGEQPAEAVKPGEAAPAPTEKPAEAEGQPATAVPVPGQEQTAPGEATPGNGQTTGEGNATPGPDSQKVPPVAGQGQGAQDQGNQGQTQGGTRRPKPAESGPPPANDNAAQLEAQPEKIEPVTSERGKRVKEREVDLNRRERPKGTEILKAIGDRVIIELNNQIMVESNDRPRMTHGARDVFYEDLPRGRTRETIERGDGTRVVTIRNSYGDVIRRSRITPDGREYVLVYVDEDNFDRVRDWRDPGRDLPPLRLDIPEDDYIMTSDRARDPDMYYEFLEQPPVERVERLYSVDEVKRSARIRDKTRRIDLDTITFEFGSASIAESEIQRLEGVADAMERILKKNPAETFLIEGHTDAVGSDLSNLALSDKRAESVASALSNVFGIPPENLATQGYGEQYLKVKTQSPERQNRRVAIRRITPLVAPMASQ